MSSILTRIHDFIEEHSFGLFIGAATSLVGTLVLVGIQQEKIGSMKREISQLSTTVFLSKYALSQVQYPQFPEEWLDER